MKILLISNEREDKSKIEQILCPLGAIRFCQHGEENGLIEKEIFSHIIVREVDTEAGKKTFRNLSEKKHLGRLSGAKLFRMGPKLEKTPNKDYMIYSMDITTIRSWLSEK